MARPLYGRDRKLQARMAFSLFGLGLLYVIGFATMIQFGSTNTLIQMMTPDRLRGRAISAYSMMYMGMTPIGSMAAGIILAEACSRPAMSRIFARALGGISRSIIGENSCTTPFKDQSRRNCAGLAARSRFIRSSTAAIDCGAYCHGFRLE